MVISQVIGGLGNQLFQYAMGYSYSRKCQTSFCIDVTAFDDYKLHGYKLNKFDITASEATANQLIAKKSYFDIGRLKNLNFKKLNNIIEPHFNYSESLKLTPSAYLQGYWQSEKYFSDYKIDLYNEFKVKKELLPNNKKIQSEMKIENSVSLHVRRGDYANNPHTLSVHGVLDLEYYLNSIDWISSKAHKPVFYIFSDEIDWVKTNFNFKNCRVVYVEGNNGENDLDDFILMQSCKHHILANSTFSWWSAWLGEQYHSSKLIIAPKNWFRDQSYNTKDLIPDRWQRI